MASRTLRKVQLLALVAAVFVAVLFTVTGRRDRTYSPAPPERPHASTALVRQDRPPAPRGAWASRPLRTAGPRPRAGATATMSVETRGHAPDMVPLDLPAAPGAPTSPAAAVPAAIPVLTAAARQKLDIHLLSALARGDDQPQRVIVQATPGAAAPVAAMLGDRPIAIVGRPSATGIVVEATVEAIADLARDDRVRRISTDAVVRAAQGGGFTDGEVLRGSLGLKSDGRLGQGGGSFTGEHVAVAVVDSGIETSKDLDRKRILAFYDYTQGGQPAAAAPYDDYGHGTHVASLIAGSGDLSGDRFQGVAKKTRLVVYKVLDGEGVGYTSDVIAAIDHAVANRHRFNIRLINLSLGHPIMESAQTDPLVRAVERAAAAGVVVVASAGNQGINAATGLVGYGGITVPGNAPSAITVGAIDINGTVGRLDDRVQPYSSRGPTWFDAYAKPDIVAPGHRIVGTAAKNGSLYREHSDLRVRAQARSESADYLRLSGTSMAAAVTSGVIAAGLGNFYHEEKDGRLSPNAVKAILHYTAVRMPGEEALSQGAGSLNPSGALRFIREFAKTKPEEWSIAALDPVDIVGGEHLTWSQQIVWGDQIIWGEQIVWGDRILRGEQIVWGDRNVFGDQIVWGESIVWDNQIVWGEQVVWGDAVLGVNTVDGVLYGPEIQWGTVNPNQVLWLLPPAEEASGNGIVVLSRRDN